MLKPFPHELENLYPKPKIKKIKGLKPLDYYIKELDKINRSKVTWKIRQEPSSPKDENTPTP